MNRHQHRSRRADKGAVAARVAVVLGLAVAAGLLAAGDDPASEWAANGCPAGAGGPIAATVL